MKKNVILAACVALVASACNQTQQPAPMPKQNEEKNCNGGSCKAPAKKSCCEAEKSVEVNQPAATVALPEVKVEKVAPVVEIKEAEKVAEVK
jgi:hypothetical protein